MADCLNKGITTGLMTFGNGAAPAGPGCLWNADSDVDKIFKLNQSGTEISSFASPSDAPPPPSTTTPALK